ncbi:MAG: hypothetical protein KA146_03175 [Leptospiraceae bacterium]|jgi:uncharacterized paraquat-inducible protein A|nr:hypothetical protein [Leptospiraceae bacterium]
MNKEKQDFIEKLNGRFGLLAILIFIGAAYIGITGSGPAKAINIWQAKMMNGQYFILLSTFLIALLFFIPLFLARTLVIYLHNKKYATQPEMKIPYFKKL